MTDGKIYNVLFLCTGNSARSILAEALLDHWGKGAVQGLQRRQLPQGCGGSLRARYARKGPSPDKRAAQQELGRVRADRALRRWTSFSPSATKPPGKLCPIWPGNPMTAHWGVPDPAAVEGAADKKRRAFRDAYVMLETRIKLFTSLRLEAIDRLAIKRKVDEIGRLRVIATGEPRAGTSARDLRPNPPEGGRIDR